MSPTSRRIFPAGLALLALSLAGAALAWACTPSGTISVSPASAPAGSQVQITGSAYARGARVEIHWNSATGPVVGAVTAGGESFTLNATIPKAPADVHTLVAVGLPDGADRTFDARTSFTIPNTPVSPGGGQSSRPPGNNAPTAPSGTTPGSTSGTADGGAVARGERNHRSANARERVGGGSGQVGNGRGRTGAGVGATSTLPSGVTVFSDSVAPTAGRTAASPNTTAKQASAGADANPTRRSVAGDLWSGFASPRAHASLGETSSQAVEPGSAPALSMALVGLGLLTVLVGIGVAATRRRRSSARAES